MSSDIKIPLHVSSNVSFTIAQDMGYYYEIQCRYTTKWSAYKINNKDLILKKLYGIISFTNDT